MTVTIDSSDMRSIKAIQIAAGAGQWIKCRTFDGEVAFGIPSQCTSEDGRYYVVTRSSCDCQDFKRHGLRLGRIGTAGDHRDCKHVRAVQLHDELVRAQRAQPRRRQLRVLPVTRILDSFRED